MTNSLLRAFLENESDAIPSLLECLRNPSGKAKAEIHYNLFDFEIDFRSGLVHLSEVCGIFGTTREPSEEVVALSDLIIAAENHIGK